MFLTAKLKMSEIKADLEQAISNKPSKKKAVKLINEAQILSQTQTENSGSTTISQNFFRVEEVYFKCYFCETYFHRCKDTVQHMKTCQPNKDTLICQKCGKCFKSYTDTYFYHSCLSVSTKDNNKSLICFYCPDRYKMLKSLRSHITTKHPSKLIVRANDVQEINKIVSRKANALKLSQTRTENTGSSTILQNSLRVEEVYFKCYFCETYFLRFKYTLQHMKTCQPNMANFICQKCGKCFKSYTFTYFYHPCLSVSTKDNKKSLICFYCPVRFKGLSSLRAHIRTKHPSKLIVRANDVQAINKNVSRKANSLKLSQKKTENSNVSVNLQDYFRVEEVYHKCCFCDTHCLGRKHILQHMKTCKPNETSFICQKCGKRFYSNTLTYFDHPCVSVSPTSSEKALICFYCPGSALFSTLKNLRMHISKTHQSELILKAADVQAVNETVSQKFSSLSSRIKVGDTEHFENLCDDTTSEVSGFQDNFSIDEIYFLCLYCNKLYLHLHQLEAHAKTEHDMHYFYLCLICKSLVDFGWEIPHECKEKQIGKKFKCFFCKTGDFSTEESLRIHINFNHEDKIVLCDNELENNKSQTLEI